MELLLGLFTEPASNECAVVMTGLMILLGGTQVGPSALLRFYVLHCIALPLLAVAL